MAASGNVIGAFSEDHAAALTGLTNRQLAYWRRQRIVQPSFAYENPRSPFSRIYTFRDLVALRVVEQLRNKVRLQEIREVAEKLRAYGNEKWTRFAFDVWNGKITYRAPFSRRTEEVVSGQGILNISIKAEALAVQKAIESLSKRDYRDIGKISSHKYISGNAPVIEGTRIPVRAIKTFVLAGYSDAHIIKEYPGLTPADIRAAAAYQDASVAA